MEEVRQRVVFKNKDSNHKKTYANKTYVSQTPHTDAVLIDFYEEIPVPEVPTEQIFYENNEVEVKFDQDENVLVVERERLLTVTIPKEQAKRMALLILETIGEADAE